MEAGRQESSNCDSEHSTDDEFFGHITASSSPTRSALHTHDADRHLVPPRPEKPLPLRFSSRHAQETASSLSEKHRTGELLRNDRANGGHHTHQYDYNNDIGGAVEPEESEGIKGTPFIGKTRVDTA